MKRYTVSKHGLATLACYVWLLGAPGFLTMSNQATAQTESKINDAAWLILRPAMLKLQAGGSRAEFQATCKKLLADYRGSRYDRQLQSLIVPLEREATAALPSFLQKAASERTPEEVIRTWIFQLREVGGRQFSDPGYPEIFSLADTPMATDQLVAIGPPAIPDLIEALDDDTPTRTIAWQRSFYPIYFVLRRQDLAMKCLERIVGCEFYHDGSTSTHLHNDTPARRESAVANVRAWWKLSEGKTQAQMIRNQLGLREQNLTLRGYDKIHALQMLAMLEGPEDVIAEMRSLLAADRYGLNSPIVEAMQKIDPQEPIRAAFTRFRQQQSREGDYTILLRYGDRALYQEMARQFEATGQLDRSGWNLGDEVRYAARYGKNWAIPLLAKALESTKMTGSRGFGRVESQPFSDADVAIEEFQKLTGRDFGYRPENSVAQRLAAIDAARGWWLSKGRAALREKINADHAPAEAAGDLFLTDEEISRRVAALQSADASTRRQATGALGEVHSYRIQRALLTALVKESQAASRIQILRVLQQHPTLWHLPQLADVLEKDADTSCRVLAGQIIKKVVADKSSMLWWSRLESRDAALDAARRLARDEKAASQVREVAMEILRAWGSSVDKPLLGK